MSVIARLTVTLDRAEFGGNARVEDADPLLPEERQQPFSFLVGHDKLHLDRHVGCQLEKMLLVQDAVAAESRDRAKRGAAVDAHFLGPLEQPLEQRDVLMRAILVNVEAKQGAAHATSLIVARATRRRASVAAAIRLARSPLSGATGEAERGSASAASGGDPSRAHGPKA